MSSDATLDRLLASEYGRRVWHVRIEPNDLTRALADSGVLEEAVAALSDADGDRLDALVLLVGRMTYTQVSRVGVGALLELAASVKDDGVADNALSPLGVFMADSRLPDAFAPIPAEPLRTLAMHRRWRRRHTALRALWLLEPETAREPLERALDGDQYDVDGALDGMAHINEPWVIERLHRLLSRTQAPIRRAALCALAHRIGAEALPEIREAAATWRGPKWQIIRLLAEHGGPEDVVPVAAYVRRLATGNVEDFNTSQFRYLLGFLETNESAPAARRALDAVAAAGADGHLTGDQLAQAALAAPARLGHLMPPGPPPSPVLSDLLGRGLDHPDDLRAAGLTVTEHVMRDPSNDTWTLPVSYVDDGVLVAGSGRIISRDEARARLGGTMARGDERLLDPLSPYSVRPDDHTRA